MLALVSFLSLIIDAQSSITFVDTRTFLYTIEIWYCVFFFFIVRTIFVRDHLF